MRFNLAFFQTPTIRKWLILLIAISLYFPITVNSASIGLFVVYWVIFIKNSEKKSFFLKNIWLILATCSFYLISIVSVLYSVDTSAALFDLEKKMSLLIFPLLLLSQKPISKTELKQIIYYFSLFTTGMCIVTLVINFFTQQTLLTNQALGSLIHIHASYFGLYVGFSLFVIIN